MTDETPDNELFIDTPGKELFIVVEDDTGALSRVVDVFDNPEATKTYLRNPPEDVDGDSLYVQREELSSDYDPGFNFDTEANSEETEV